jgi:transcriptional regulator with XRE-family HTH domain
VIYYSIKEGDISMGLDKIEEYKKKLGLTSAELAEKAGIPKTTLDKILSGVTKDPKLETLKAIARVLGLSLDEFDDRDIPKSNEYEPTYEDIQSLIARNGKNLSLEQKQNIIKTLLSDD